MSAIRSPIGAVLGLALILAAARVNGQAPRSSPPPPPLPQTFFTGELPVRVVPVATGLSHPWSLRPTPLDQATSASIGTLLMSTYVLPFEIASLLLTAAMIGAIVIARE